MKHQDLTEFQQLRYEIMESDRISIWILAYAFIISSAILSLNETVGRNINFNYLLLLVQLVWVLSFFYISTKRYSIMTIACYIKEELEKGSKSLNWENWHRKERGKLPSPIDMYTIETITCITASALIFIYLLDQNVNYELALSGIILSAFICFAIYNYWNYIRLTRVVKYGLGKKTKDKKRVKVR